MENKKKSYTEIVFATLFFFVALIIFLHSYPFNSSDEFSDLKEVEEKSSEKKDMDLYDYFLNNIDKSNSSIMNVRAIRRHSLPSSLYFDSDTNSWNYKHELNPESFLFTILYTELASLNQKRAQISDQEKNKEEAFELIGRIWKSFEVKDALYSSDTLYLIPYIYELNNTEPIIEEFQDRAFKLVETFKDLNDLSDHPLNGTERLYYQIRALNSLNQYFHSLSLSPSRELIQTIDTIKSFAKDVPNKNNPSLSPDEEVPSDSLESNEKEMNLFCTHLWANAPLLKVINDEEKETFKSIYSESMATFEARIKDRNNGFKDLHTVIMCLDAFIDADTFLALPFKSTFELTIKEFLSDTWSFPEDEKCPNKYGFFSTREENTDCRKRKIILRDNVWMDYLIYKIKLNPLS